MNGSGVTSAAPSNNVILSGQQTRCSDTSPPPKVNDPKVNKIPDFPVHPPSTQSTSLFSRAIDTVTDIIRWPIENRLGVAKLFGTLVVPAQFTRTNLPSLQLLAEACNQKNQKSGHRVQLDLAIYGDTKLMVAVCYPPNWPNGDTSRCVLYHNPNRITIASYFRRNYYDVGGSEQNRFDPRIGHSGLKNSPPTISHLGLKQFAADQVTSAAHSPGIIQDIRQCPIILYDYRGAGINEQATPFFPTCQTVVEDGRTTLHYALTHFDQVEVFGTSLGGAVSTASLDSYQCSTDVLKDRIKKVNVLDSFSDTSHVLFPAQGHWIENLGWLFGAHIDGKKHVDSLISKGFNVAIANHTHDEIIPPEARLASHIPTQKVSRPNVQVHLSSGKTNQFLYLNHGTLTEDVQHFLNKDKDD